MIVTFDNTSAQQRFLTANTGTVSHTCNGTNRFLYVNIVTAGTPVSTVTVGGVSAILIGTSGLDASGRRMTTYGSVNPASGANSVVVTLTGTDASLVIYTSSYNGVNQLKPIITSGIIVYSTTTGISQTLDYAGGGYLIMSGTWSSGTPTPLTNCVIRQNEVAYIGSWQIDNTTLGNASSTVGFTCASQMLAGVAISLNPAMPVLAEGLVSYYPLNSNSTDSLGANNGTDTAMSYGAPNKLGTGAGQFNGTTSIINLGSAAAFDDLLECTYSCWINPTNFTAEHMLFGKFQRFLRIRSGVDAGKVDWTITFGTTSATGTTNAFLTAGSWNHVVFTYSNTGDRKVHIYVNGVECTYASNIASVGTLTSDAAVNQYIGTYDNTPYLPYLGSIQHFGIWSRALTAIEVYQLYGDGSGAIYPLFQSTKETFMETRQMFSTNWRQG